MPNIIGVGQISLLDLNDAIVAGVPPSNPTVGSLWIDESEDPPMLKKWNGEAWIDLGELDPDLSETLEFIDKTLGNMANDNLIDFGERQVIKDRLTEIIGYVISDTDSSLPTSVTLDSSGRGGFWSVRKSAINVGIPADSSTYINVATSYDNLKSYLDGLTPINVWDTLSDNAEIVVPVTKSTFRDKWLQYYLAVDALAELTVQKVKENNDKVQENVDGVSRDLGKLEGKVTEVENKVTDEAIVQAVTRTEMWAQELNNINDGVRKYVQSRGENLVTNGTGLLKDNTNFSSFEFDGSQAFAGGGSFKTTRQNGTLFNDELIPVDTDKEYRLSLMAKSLTGLGHNYFGTASYDIDGHTISPYNFYGSQFDVVELTRDLKVGDTVIHLSDVSEFRDDQDTPNHYHSIVFWGYKNSSGYEYPESTYSRLTFTIGWDAGAINEEDKTITLNRPFDLLNPNDQNGVFRAGHKVSPTHSGGSYQYNAGSNVKVSNDDWDKFEGTISGTGIGSDKFPHGTSYVKLLFLTNRSSSGGEAGDALWINSIEFTDVTDISLIGSRISNVEQSITADGIFTTISESVDYQNVMNSKVDTESLGDYATKDELDDLERDIYDGVDEAIAGINFEPFVTKAELEETSRNITAKFSATGGMNLIKNSVGFAGGEFWDIFNYVDTIQSDHLDTLGFGSGFRFTAGRERAMGQVIPVVGGVTYTLSWWVLKANTSTSDGALHIQFKTPDNEAVLEEYVYTDEETTDGYVDGSIQYTAESDGQVMVKIHGFSETEGVITGLMMNIGDIPLQWSLATGELYNTNIRMDIKGIRVSQLDDNRREIGYTHISPDEFAGYYDSDGDGVFEKIFYLNGEETVTKKLRAINEITMGSIKIININRSGHNGWAFVPIVEE